MATSFASRALGALNGRLHREANWAFLAIVVAHWAEHVVQAVQVFALGWPRPESRGLLGHWFPALVESEALHYGYALVMLIGLWILRSGFAGRARLWWDVAFGIQVWHHFEHALLGAQALVGSNLLGHETPTSILQLVVPRVELHLFYNAAVFVPMVVAMLLHIWPAAHERAQVRCACAVGHARAS